MPLRLAKPRTLLAYNQPVLAADDPAYASEVDILETVLEIEKALQAEGLETAQVGYARRPHALFDAIEQFSPDVIFNLFEGEADRSETEISNAATLEWIGIPFTGSNSTTIALGRDKIRTKFLLQGAGIPTCPFAVVERLPVPFWTKAWPAIVKPCYQDASVGIDQESVVTDQEQLAARVSYVLEKFGGPVIVEQFVSGREFHVNLIESPGLEPGSPELIVVPPAEVEFDAVEGRSLWPIYSYSAKWDEESIEYKSRPIRTALTLPDPLNSRITEVCCAAYRLMGMQDYGRVDVRLTADDQIFVIEVNPNPYLNSIMLVDGLRKMEKSFSSFARDITVNALMRGPSTRKS
jgi:D-alanine-D-alanine ligase